MEVKNGILDIGDIAVDFSSRRTDGDDEYLHSHDFVEAFLVETGSVEHEVNGVLESLYPGDLRILFPGVSHRFIRHGACIHRDFLIRNRFYDEIGDSIDHDFFALLKQEKTRLIRVSTQDILYLEDKNTIFFGLPDGLNKHKMERSLATILFLLFYTDGPKEENPNPFKTQVSDLINQFFSYPDAAKRIRSKLSYNEKYFCKKFKESFDVTFIAYLNQKKMEYAKYLLQMTDYSMEEICAKVGIESASYFHKVYQKTFGETPSKTRKNGQKKEYPFR
ncbi:MAG: AraC family transcriptional regulator [Erysipelotrichaceae bacterium]|nr:AraC family transcriptional regulator [Erysipelotrichaceae bacterium]